MNKGRMSFRSVLLMMTLPLIAALIVSVFFSNIQIQGTFSDAEKLYFEKLYTINTELINADRDFYQAMLASSEYQIHKDHHDADEADELAELVKEFQENMEQVEQRVHDSLSLAKQNPDLYTGTTSENGSTFEQLDQSFEAALKEFEAAYDITTDTGSYEAQDQEFSVAREYLSEMLDVSEAWAEKENSIMSKSISKRLTLITSIFAVVVVILLGFTLIILRVIMKGLRSISASIQVLAKGNFVTPIDTNLFILELYKIAARMENMRSQLQESLLKVVHLAGRVDSGAIDTQTKIADSQQMSSDISSAVSDIAYGATSMAHDVQSTSDLTVNIGTSVESVLDSTTDNSDAGKQVYLNAENVKAQLVQLKKTGEDTDVMATEVSDSVNETSEFVGKISTAAEAIIGIASQTNLLALNASIEAARAGEVGKGFAVVADNIKGLAEESDTAAKEITGMLSRIVQLSDKNKDLTSRIKEATQTEVAELQEMAAAFDEMMVLLERTENGNATIISLVQSLKSDRDSVMNSVESLSSISEQNAASTEETSASLDQLSMNMDDVVSKAKELQLIAHELQESIGFFTVE